MKAAQATMVAHRSLEKARVKDHMSFTLRGRGRGRRRRRAHAWARPHERMSEHVAGGPMFSTKLRLQGNADPLPDSTSRLPQTLSRQRAHVRYGHMAPRPVPAHDPHPNPQHQLLLRYLSSGDSPCVDAGDHAKAAAEGGDADPDAPHHSGGLGGGRGTGSQPNSQSVSVSQFQSVPDRGIQAGFRCVSREGS